MAAPAIPPPTPEQAPAKTVVASPPELANPLSAAVGTANGSPPVAGAGGAAPSATGAPHRATWQKHDKVATPPGPAPAPPAAATTHDSLDDLMRKAVDSKK
jgi:hypothetical protein